MNPEEWAGARSCRFSMVPLSMLLLTIRFYPGFLRNSLKDFKWREIYPNLHFSVYFGYSMISGMLTERLWKRDDSDL